ncbi:hypothetical protein [Saccharothrix syringae]|uniref:Uncharacterized protein n=1 Tax=Saccharothrix syringae TaxID=103733 RepID=A0A5Q0GW91_SACSY|nr:hypothetical protein [Saccharothrix syringae]QFZ18163.1 hypothetical protein EKG83_12320 [Saccharothrix syringae]
MPESADPVPQRRFSLSRSQLMWATLGVVVAIVIAALAFSNLREVYNSQKDFVVGLLASLAGVCFTRAFSRTNEDAALDLIRRAPPGPVGEALDDVVRRRLDRDGVFEGIALLERNVEAAQDRLSEYYHAQSQVLDFYRHAPLLRVVVSDLDKVFANAVTLRRALSGTGGPERYRLDPEERQKLIGIRRDLRESVGRKNTAYEALARTDAVGPEAWDVFAVMTGDVLKAEIALEGLLCDHVRFPPEETLRSTVDYLDAARRRAEEFRAAIGEENSPMVFDIMLADLSSAIDALRRVDLPDADSPRRGRSRSR